ncbi:MAG: hypothetical protein GY754_31065 [bacterium]|nr:hypothetical protein [bacterium]
MAIYPKKLENNPIEFSGLPAKAVTSLQIWNESGQDYCYIGYGSTKNYGPARILKHQPAPCRFILNGLANDEGLSRYLILNNGSDNELYATGTDSCEQRGPSLTHNRSYTIVGRRDSLSGTFYTAVSRTEDFRNGTVVAPTEEVYPVDPEKSSDLSIALDQQYRIIAFHTVSGKLYYCFGQINRNEDGFTIAWEPAQPFKINDTEIECEELPVAANDNQFVLVYRFFYKIFTISGEWPPSGP